MQCIQEWTKSGNGTVSLRLHILFHLNTHVHIDMIIVEVTILTVH